LFSSTILTFEKIEISVWISEREAVITLPRLDGKFDYLVFSSSGERARKWCMDVFDYYWERATQVADIGVPNAFKTFTL